MGPVTYMAVFDDNKTKDVRKVDASEAVELILDLSWAQVMSFVRGMYASGLPEQGSNASKLLKGAQLLFARCMAYQRHPEYVKTYGAEPDGKLWSAGVALMKRIQSAEQQIPPNDNPPEANPGNVGTIVYDDSPKIAVPSNPDSPNKNTALGDW